MSAITIGQDFVHYEGLGRGRPVVLTHGWLGSWMDWVPVLQQLQAQFRLYAMDFIGYGDSGKYNGSYGIRSQANLVGQFTQKLGLQRTALIGYGLGATVALQYAVSSPQSVARLLLVGLPLETPANRPAANESVHFVFDPAAAQAAVRLTPPSVLASAALAQAGGEFDSIDMAQHELALRLAEPEAALLESSTLAGMHYTTLRTQFQKADHYAIREASAQANPQLIWKLLSQLTVPTVVLHLPSDPLATGDNAMIERERDALRRSNISFYDLPDAPPFPMLTYEPFGRLVKDFLVQEDLDQLSIKHRWRRRSR